MTRDFREVRRLGPVMPPEDKDAALFPRRFNGRWAMIHRPSPLRGGSHMWISYSPDLRHWGDHTLLIESRKGAWWDADKIGLGPPPLATPDGWLVMYHGAHLTASGPIYRVGFALLDLEQPEIVLRRSDNWVLGPQADYERVGDVNKVVFPNGWVVDEETGRSIALLRGRRHCRRTGHCQPGRGPRPRAQRSAASASPSFRLARGQVAAQPRSQQEEAGDRPTGDFGARLGPECRTSGGRPRTLPGRRRQRRTPGP